MIAIDQDKRISIFRSISWPFHILVEGLIAREPHRPSQLTSHKIVRLGLMGKYKVGQPEGPFEGVQCGLGVYVSVEFLESDNLEERPERG
jgi:hypothetical protein